MIMKKILFVFGTRPEAIKLAPLIKEMEKDRKSFRVIVALTAQHRALLDQVLDFFKIKADYDLNLMKPGQSLFDITAASLRGLEKVLADSRPDLVVVQGDTTTAFAAALAAYYRQIPVAHIEAGLRTDDKYSPFPEEINRRLISQLADHNFAPTAGAARNLARAGVRRPAHVVGNTVIDALRLGLATIKQSRRDFAKDFPGLDFRKRLILVTGHRRENFGAPLEDICAALRDIARAFPDLQIVYPVHPNPQVKRTVEKSLGAIRNIRLLPPLAYPRLIWLMSRSYFIITDSGGLQEEAPFLGKPLLVTREKTERPEGVRAGTAILVGHERRKIVRAARRLLTDAAAYRRMSRAGSPYGDGTSSRKIVKILKNIK